MRGIVLKLFLLTTTLCLLILAIIFIGQTIFFKQYYVNKKVTDLKDNIQVFESDYKSNIHNAVEVQQLERLFTQENNAWITILDQRGNLKYENDFYLEFQLEQHEQEMYDLKSMKVPLYALTNIDNGKLEQASETLMKNGRVYTIGFLDEEILIPIEITVESDALLNKDFPIISWVGPMHFENEWLKNKSGDPSVVLKESMMNENEHNLVGIGGEITDIAFPKSSNLSYAIYSNPLFLAQINKFQTELLMEEKNPSKLAIQEAKLEQNGVAYTVLIKPVREKNGTMSYIFSMSSLQPVDEAISMIEDYYIYIVIVVFCLILFASYYYSKTIAKPLLIMNQTTEKIANLDFSETIPIHSKDEIGDLSHNINQLSRTLHAYIDQLQQDIEKEKQLEKTRKEFISGVSHELKTPLSVMKSCITILKGNIANHKKDYYFDAMEQEVDKMDDLIVDMLELSKYESGTYNMKMNSFYIDKLIREIHEKLKHDIQQKGLQVKLNLEQIEVVANERRMEQVLTNFITNAIRYTSEGKEIKMSTLRESGFVKICVENQGAHIDEEHLEKIWDRFYRIDASRRRVDGGTGLGLAISKNILELHDAEYGVCNTKEGVLFYFYLPIV